MRVELTLGRFPSTRTYSMIFVTTECSCVACTPGQWCMLVHSAPGTCAADLQERCAAPFGFTLEPFAYNDAVPLNKQPKPAMADIPRCSECGAYINCYCGLDSIGWRCSVCGAYSEYVQQQIRKYSQPAIRETQPELQRHVYEALCPSYDSQSVREGVHCIWLHLRKTIEQHHAQTTRNQDSV